MMTAQNISMRQVGPFRGLWKIRDVSPRDFTFRFWVNDRTKIRVTYERGALELKKYSCLGRTDHYGKLDVLFRLDLKRGGLHVERTNAGFTNNNISTREYHPKDQAHGLKLKEMRALLGFVSQYTKSGENPNNGDLKLLMNVISAIDEVCGEA